MLRRVVHDEVTSAELLLRIPIGGVLLCVRQARSQQTMLGVSRISGGPADPVIIIEPISVLFSPLPSSSLPFPTPPFFTLPSVRVVRKDQGVEWSDATRGLGVRRVYPPSHGVGSGKGLFIYLLLKSYPKYKIDRDRNIAHDTDKNMKT